MKIKPWKILKAIATGIKIATQLHDAHKESGKSIEDFVKDQVLNDGLKSQLDPRVRIDSRV